MISRTLIASMGYITVCSYSNISLRTCKRPAANIGGAYSYACEGARCHILEEREIWRETLIAIWYSVSDLNEALNGQVCSAKVCTYSYSSTGSAVGWAIGTATTESPPNVLGVKARLSTSPRSPGRNLLILSNLQMKILIVTVVGERKWSGAGVVVRVIRSCSSDDGLC